MLVVESHKKLRLSRLHRNLLCWPSTFFDVGEYCWDVCLGDDLLSRYQKGSLVHGGQTCECLSEARFRIVVYTITQALAHNMQHMDLFTSNAPDQCDLERHQHGPARNLWKLVSF